MDDYLTSKYGLQAAASGDAMGLAPTVIHGAVAAVTDFGATVWNSLPGTEEVQTADLLSRIDNDALQVYNEHPEAVQAASFIGGAFVPMGIALKGMNLYRSGSKAVNWFTKAGEVSQLQKVEAAFAKAGPLSKEVRDLQNGLYRAAAYNAVVDSVVAEAAIVGTMNAHPFMDDYMKDPGENFLFWSAIGAGIGAPLAMIGARGVTKTLTHRLEEKKLVNILGKVKVGEEVAIGKYLPIEKARNVGEQLQIMGLNVRNWEAKLARSADKNIPDYQLTVDTTETLKHLVDREKANISILYKEAYSGSEELTPALLKSHTDRIISDPRFLKVDKWKFLSPSSAIHGVGAETTEAVPSFFKTIKNKLTGQERDITQGAVFYPSLNAFSSLKDSSHHASLADGVRSIEQIIKEAKNSNPMWADHDIGLELFSMPTAHAELVYAKELALVSSYSVEDLNKMVVSATDLPRLKAIEARIKQLSPEEQLQVKITTTTELPTYGARLRYTLNKVGVSPDYPKRLTEMREVFDDTFSITYKGIRDAAGVSKNLSLHLNQWICGDTQYLRNAIHGWRNGVRNPTTEALAELKAHPRSVALRKELAKHADVDGYVYLYRGMKTSPKGHAPLESYSLTPSKAAQFKGAAGDVRLYKVHVDDILGGFRDIGSGTHNDEILVLSPTRESRVIDLSRPHEIPMDLVSAVETGKEIVETGTRRLSSIELAALAKEKTLADIRTMVFSGMAVDSIALRSGTPLKTVQEILSGIEDTSLPLTKFNTMDDIKAALDPTNRAIVVTGNLKKRGNAAINANLNIKKADDIASNLLSYYMQTSPSSLVREIGDFFATPEMKTIATEISREITQVTSSGMYSLFATSLNRTMEKWGIAGRLALNIGKDITTISNRVSEKFVVPLTQAGGKILKNQAATVEHNIAVNFNASLSGWRIYDKETGKILQKAIDPITKEEMLVPAQYQGKDFQIIDADVRKMFELYQDAGKEMYYLSNLRNKVMGKPDINNLGFWIPPVNPRDKQIAYAFDIHTGATTMLYARTPGELLDGVAAYKEKLKADGLGHVRVVMKGDQQRYFNELAGRHDPMYMGIADVSLRHGGASASAIIKTNAEPMTEIVNSYEHFLHKGVETSVELQLQPVMDKLKIISELSQLGYEKGTLGVIGKFSKAQVDSGQVLRNAILGQSNLSQHKAWQEWQQRGQVATDMAIGIIGEIFSPIVQPLKGKLFSKGMERNEETWRAINAQLESNGFTPFRGIDAYERYLKEGTISKEASTPRFVALTNGLAATSLLRFLDIAQPLVNMVSLPILTSGAISRKLESSFMNGVIDTNAKFSVHSAMFNGIRLMNHPEGARLRRIAIEKNLFTATVSEANEVLAHTRSLEAGAIAKGEELLQSSFVKVASWTADKSEQLVREAAFFIGASIAKKAYPGLSDTGVMTFARNFMDEAIGNYTASQRPAFFQGTFGVAFGLFQTYMLTLAQHIYRQVEAKDWAALGRMMLTQSTIFGASSLPGFHMVSKAIGESFSDNHYDLETGTFKVIGDETANILLYGMLSSFGPGITTRGDIQPRIPTPLTLDTVATVNLTKQAYLAGERLVSAAFTQDGNTGRAMLEALSLQSLNRPVARISELISGNSITGAGHLMASPAEIYTTQGIVSRLMATRPLEEIKARQVDALDSYYGAIDSDRRKDITKRLRTMLRDGSLDGEKVQELQYEYMRFGNANGWRAAVREARAETQKTGIQRVKDSLSPNAVYNVMIDDTD